MNKIDVNLIKGVLRDLKAVSVKTQNVKADDYPYPIYFWGDKFNIIHSDNLLKLLNEHMQIKITHYGLLELLPEICPDLGMSLKGMQEMKDEKPTGDIDLYKISLY